MIFCLLSSFLIRIQFEQEFHFNSWRRIVVRRENEQKRFDDDENLFICLTKSSLKKKKKLSLCCESFDFTEQKWDEENLWRVFEKEEWRHFLSNQFHQQTLLEQQRSSSSQRELIDICSLSSIATLIFFLHSDGDSLNDFPHKNDFSLWRKILNRTGCRSEVKAEDQQWNFFYENRLKIFSRLCKIFRGENLLFFIVISHRQNRFLTIRFSTKKIPSAFLLWNRLIEINQTKWLLQQFSPEENKEKSFGGISPSERSTPFAKTDEEEKRFSEQFWMVELESKLMKLQHQWKLLQQTKKRTFAQWRNLFAKSLLMICLLKPIELNSLSCDEEHRTMIIHVRVQRRDLINRFHSSNQSKLSKYFFSKGKEKHFISSHQTNWISTLAQAETLSLNTSLIWTNSLYKLCLFSNESIGSKCTKKTTFLQ